MPKDIAADRRPESRSGKFGCLLDAVCTCTTVLLCFFYATAIALWVGFSYQTRPEAVSIGVLSIGFLLVIVALTYIYGILLKKKRRPLVRLLMWSVFLVPFLVMVIDSPPPAGDYSLSNLPAITEKGREANAILENDFMSPADFEMSPGLVNLLYYSEDRFSNILAYAQEIDAAWAAISNQRHAVARLGEYDVIPEILEEEDLAFEEDRVSPFLTVRRTLRIYQAYALLKTEQGDPQSAARELGQLHDLLRRCEDVTLIGRMVRIAFLGLNARTAYEIAQHPACDAETLEILEEAFPPLPDSVTSLENQYLVEYLAFRDLMERTSPSEYISTCRDLMPIHEIGTDDTPRQPVFVNIERGFSTVVYGLFVKPNRTMKDMRELTDKNLAEERDNSRYRRPPRSAVEDYHGNPRLLNLGGWFLIRTCTGASMDNAAESMRRTDIHCDLLAIYLAERNGGKVVLDDYYGSGSYAVTSNGSYFSVGPDGTTGTCDDIKLEWPRW
jgi:hypothetical protein